jgi:hypothetical protein
MRIGLKTLMILFAIAAGSGNRLLAATRVMTDAEAANATAGASCRSASCETLGPCQTRVVTSQPCHDPNAGMYPKPGCYTEGHPKTYKLCGKSFSGGATAMGCNPYKVPTPPLGPDCMLWGPSPCGWVTLSFCTMSYPPTGPGICSCISGTPTQNGNVYNCTYTTFPAGPVPPYFP